MDCLTPEIIRDAVERMRKIKPCGIRIVETVYITKEVQRRTHRKKRINKKWRKRYGMMHVEDPYKSILYKDPEGDNVLYVHPKMADKLREKAMDTAHKYLFGDSEQFK